MLAAVMKTADGRFRVYIYADQTAELCDGNSRLLVGRCPMYKIAAKLAEMGVDSADLTPT